jgi:hypothetical protein
MSELKEKVDGKLPVRISGDGQLFVTTRDLAECALQAAEEMGFQGGDVLAAAAKFQEGLLEMVGRLGYTVVDIENERVFVPVTEGFKSQEVTHNGH